MSSLIIFCDENDGPNVDINASAEGNCDMVVFEEVLRGERGSLLSDRGLFINGEGINPETCVDTDTPALAVASCHSFDLAVLIPRLCLELKGVSLSLGDKFNVLIRPQSLEKTPAILWRMLLSTATASHSARESFVIETQSFFPPTRLSA